MADLIATSRGSPWIRCPFPRGTARLRLLCLPHAGGTASVYHPWGRLIGDDVEVWAIELPGHGSRFHEPPARSLEQVADTLARELTRAGLMQAPFALFGHSMGGILAYEVACRFRDVPTLRHLFASGCHAPQTTTDEPPIHTLPPGDFLAALAGRYDGIPRELLAEKELLDLILPALQADMEMVERHRHRPCAPLPVPITALAGTGDARATPEVLAGWQLQTAGPFELLRFPGGHFYLQGALADVLRTIRDRTLMPTGG